MTNEQIAELAKQAGAAKYVNRHYPHKASFGFMDGQLEAFVQLVLKAGLSEPVAWMTFDGEGGHDLRLYDMNESYREDYIKRNGDKYASWVQPLYSAATPPAQPVVQHLPADDTEGGAL